MIQQLASRYQRKVAAILLLLNCPLLTHLNGYAMGGSRLPVFGIPAISHSSGYRPFELPARPGPLFGESRPQRPIAGYRIAAADSAGITLLKKTVLSHTAASPTIGGPGQPEMSSFKPVSADNLVNLFTGDFSYNIPLMDVGGYPVNIFYSGGVGNDQEASWVGTGWNLNPGTISRNMRGVPDDFNGEDTLLQSQNMKPNKTWGASLGADVEICGIKQMPSFLSLNFGLTLGASFNNYLGPALDVGVKNGVGLKLAQKTLSEKGVTDDISLNAGLNVDANSRSGVTLSPSVSLTASQNKQDVTSSFGVGLSTSYNSRSGIKALQIAEQVHFNKSETDYKVDPETQQVTVQNLSSSYGISPFATSISFAKPSYIPSIRMPLTNSAFSGHFQLGGAIFGVYGSAELEVYQQTSKVSADKILQKKPLVGYLYYEKAMNNPNTVMDFTRFNDREVTPNTPIISVPQYTYDVFSIQGEGTGGSVRAYRSEPGYVRDNTTGSTDQSDAVGGDVGIPGHFGANFNTVKTPSTIGEWAANNAIHTGLAFKAPQTDTTFENVSFRNPGEGCVLDPSQYARIGGTDLVRFRLSGTNYSPGISPTLDRFSARIPGVLLGSVNIDTTRGPSGRHKRGQLVEFLTATDASTFGLDRQLKSYDNQTILDPATDTLRYTSFPRIDLAGGYRKHHHISQINVTEASGRRYVYGIPVYNITQKDFTFTVDSSQLSTPGTTDKIGYATGANDPVANPDINGGTGSRDGYVQVTQTPAYAHSFLLSGVLSPDYMDLTGDGITDDDPGDAVKFNYTRIKAADGSWAVHNWRTPADQSKANFLVGNRTDVKDDKGTVSYGQRESWYLHSIESKTMIALFTLGDRADGKGATGENGAVNSSDASVKLLQKIDLYSKSDLRKNGLAHARPVKTVHFVYSYRLCQGTPDNPVGQTTTFDNQGKGKLTLEQIYFTYNGTTRAKKDMYVFSYLNSDGSGNPAYSFGASDRWGTYKPASMNPVSMLNSDYPYTPQEQQGQSVSPKTALDQNAGAWSLKKILLPSGGQIEVDYESDDYAYVQNQRAANFLPITGFGSSPTTMAPDRLYNLSGTPTENDYVFIRVPQPCTSATDVYNKYLQGMNQLGIKLAVKMPAGVEPVTCYANIVNYGVYDATHIWVQLKEVSGMSALSLTALEFLREQLPGQAFTGYDVSESSGLQQIGEMLIGLLDGIKNTFTDPIKALRSDGKARYVELDKCFARVNEPRGVKYGGGHRVKAIRIKDNWQQMSNQFTATYQQLYDYTTTEVFNGTTRTISSGVAAYEPSIGGDENPIDTIKQVVDKLPLGPASYGAIEMPVLDAFFPAPEVGYSKVTIRTPSAVTPGAGRKLRAGMGRKVTEFYTAKDYPVHCNNTSFDPSTDKQEHDASTTAFFYKYAFDSRAVSQGFIVELNDMHGKMKTQTTYADNDSTQQISRTEQYYRNTGINGPSDQFDVVASNGAISSGNIGIDVELMTDTREFSVKSSSQEIEAQVDLFPVFLPFWIPFIWPVSGNSENTYRAVTTTKVVNYHSVLDSVVTIDKSSHVDTKNILYDAETGQVVVKRMNNEFEQPVFSTTYPAWWAYGGMSPAYRNEGMTFTGVSFSQGRITSPTNQSHFESGDELLVTSQGNTGLQNCDLSQASANVGRLWIMDTAKNSSSLTNTAPYFMFIDSLGKPFTKAGVTMRIIRSGKRNMMDEQLAGVTSMVSPVVAGSPRKLSLGASSNVVTATAAEFREKWQVDDDRIKRFTLVTDPTGCGTIAVADCNSSTRESSINPYVKGLLGNFRTNRSEVFYSNRMDTTTTVPTNLPKNGFLKNFVLYWDFNGSGNLAPNTSSPQWVWNNQITKINARTQELESENALGIYTAAQYGYNKTLPMAITNNARYNEVFYEGFEDYSFVNNVDNNGVAGCSNDRHADFTPASLTNVPAMDTASIINADSAGFNAHTGKYVLAVRPNSTVSKSFNFTPGAGDNPALVFRPDSTYNLVDVGGQIINKGVYPTMFAGFSQASIPPVNFSSNGVGMYSINGSATTWTSDSVANSQYWFSEYGASTKQYVQITTCRNYNFTLSVLHDHVNQCGNDANIQVTIYDLNGNMINQFYCGDVEINCPQDQFGNCTTTIYQQTISGVAFLPVGIYEIDAQVEFYHDACGATTAGGQASGFDSRFSYFSDIPGNTYKSLTSQVVCRSTDPIAADGSFVNPGMNSAFLNTGKRMVFSAWVREATLDTNYTHNSVDLVVNGGDSVMHPVGPVVDGWQRYEGYFTPFAGFGSLTLKLINSSSGTIYFDDIRIHPFNADMKSYIYDPVNLRLTAELDPNNYATFYEYDEEGTLVRVKSETRQGIKTIKETRSAKQKNLTSVQ